MTRPRRAGFLIAALAAVAGAVGAARPAFAFEAPGAELVRAKLERTLEAQLGGTARIGRLSLRPLDGRVQVEDVEWRPERGALRRLALRRAVVDLSLAELLRGDLRIEGIEAEGLDLDLRDPGGPPSRRDKPLFDGRILEKLRTLKVDGGSVHYVAPSSGLVLDVQGLKIASIAGDSLVADVEAAPVVFSAAGVPEERLDHVSARIALARRRRDVTVREAVGAVGAGRGEGGVSLTSRGILVRGRLTGDLDIAQATHDTGLPLRGRASLDALFRLASPGDSILDGSFEAEEGLEVYGFRCRSGKAKFHVGPDGTRLFEGSATTVAGGEVRDFALDHPKGKDAVVLRLAGRMGAQELFARINAGKRAEQLRGLAEFNLRLEAATGKAAAWTIDGRMLEAGAESGALSGVIAARGDGAGAEIALRGGLDGSPLDFVYKWGPAGPGGPWSAKATLKAPEGPAARKLHADVLRYLVDEGLELPKGTIPEPGGAVWIEAALSGDGNSLLGGDIPFRMTRPNWGPSPLAALSGRVVLGRRGAYSVPFRLSDEKGRGLSGRVYGVSGAPANVEALADGLPIPPVRDYLKYAFDLDAPRATGTIDAFVRGRLAWGRRELTLGGTLRGRVENSPELVVDISGDVAGDELFVREARLAGPGTKGSFAGRVTLPGGPAPWSARGRLTLTSALGEWMTAQGAGGFAGNVSYDGDVVFGGPDKPLFARGDLRWNGLALAGAAAPDGAARLTPRADGFDAALAVPGWSGSLAVSGPIWTPRLAARLSFADLDLLGLAALVRRKPLDVDADLRAGGELAFEGEAGAPERWKGHLALSSLDASTASFSARLAAPARFDLADGELKVAEDAPFAIVGATGGKISARGRVGLFGASRGRLALGLDVAADLQFLEVFDPDVLAAGKATGALKIGGSFADPDLTGALRLEGGRLRLLPYTDAVDDLQATLEFRDRAMKVKDGKFRLGGGDVVFDGTLTMPGLTPGRVDMHFVGKDFALSFPKGVWGRYDADVRLVGPASDPEVRGEVKMLAGRYTRPLEIEMAPGTRVRKLEPATSRSHWLTRIGLRVKLVAEESLAVRTEMARLQVSVGIDVTGDPGAPLFAGSVVFVEGGKITFRGVDYEVSSGQIIFDDPRGEPMRLRMRMTTDVRGYSVRLDLDATPDTLDYQLTSAPALSQRDILLLLLTGQPPTEVATGAAGQVTSELATSYFGTQLGEFLLAGPARKYLGLNRFGIAPSVVGAETRPTARLTVGRRVDDRTTIIYSRDLSSEGRDLYRIEREISRELRIALGRDEYGGVTLDLRWLHRFGETSSESLGAAPPKLGGVTIDGLPAGVKLSVRRDLGLAAGKRVPQFQLIEAREALQRVLAREGYLDAEVAPRVERQETTGRPARAVAVFDVKPGPRWDVRWNGPTTAVRRVKDVLVELWGGAGFRPDGLREATRVAREALAEDGFAAATVDVRIADEAARILTIDVDPGPRVKVGKVAFEGQKALGKDELFDQVLLRRPGVLGGISGETFKPRLAQEDADAVRTLYAARGYLEATVDPLVRLRGAGEVADVTFVVDEGPQSRVGLLRVEGDWPDELGPATAKIPFKSGDLFLPDLLKTAETKLRETLDDAGYWESRVVTRPEVLNGKVDIVFRIRAGRAATVRNVRFEGLVATKKKIVEPALHLAPGKPLSSGAIRRTERDLFRLGLFRKVEIRTEPVEGDPARRDVVVRLDENPRLSLLTTVGYDTEERALGSMTLSDDNLWGLARTGSLQAYGSSKRSGLRATIEDRHLDEDLLEGLGTLGIEREERDGFTLETTGIALQLASPQQRRGTRVQLRYELEDNRFTNVTLDPDAIQQVLSDEGRRLDKIRLGGFLGTLILDRRDDPFLPTRGWIARAEAGIWGKALLSEATFARVTGQVAGYVPKGRLTLAGSTRFGLAWPFKDTAAVPLSQRFFAGGADSMRGFARDKVGPLDGPGGNALGGESMLVTNLEARYRFWGRAHAVVFYDVGNVWERASDFYKGKLRKAAGVGVQYATPFGALRAEYGWKLDRQEGESPGQFFVSIGEAF